MATFHQFKSRTIMLIIVGFKFAKGLNPTVACAECISDDGTSILRTPLSPHKRSPSRIQAAAMLVRRRLRCCQRQQGRGACRRCMRVRRRHGGWQSVRLVRSLTAASGTVAPSRPRPNRPAQNFEVPHTDQSAVVVVCADLGGFFALIVVDLGCADHRDRSTRRQGISGMILFVHASIRLYHRRVCC